MFFSEHPDFATLTELRATLDSKQAWLLHEAIEDRAKGLIRERQAADPDADVTYRADHARADALVDLALGHVRFEPRVIVTVPVDLMASAAPPPGGGYPARSALSAGQQSLSNISGDLQNVSLKSAAGRSTRTLAHASASLGAIRRLHDRPLAHAGELGFGKINDPSAALEVNRRASVDVAARMGVAVDEEAPVHALTACANASSAGQSPTRIAAPALAAPLDVPGVGQVGVEFVERLMHSVGASFTVALADADSGTTCWTSVNSYRPSATLRRFVERRDTHCRFPACMRPARFCDIDHVLPYGTEGGHTQGSNLQLLCRHHHRAKTHGGWSVSMTTDGACTWQSPTGRSFLTFPSDSATYPARPDNSPRLTA